MFRLILKKYTILLETKNFYGDEVGSAIKYKIFKNQIKIKLIKIVIFNEYNIFNLSNIEK